MARQLQSTTSYLHLHVSAPSIVDSSRHILDSDLDDCFFVGHSLVRGGSYARQGAYCRKWPLGGWVGSILTGTLPALLP